MAKFMTNVDVKEMNEAMEEYEAAKAAVPEAVRLAGQATSMVANFHSLADTAAKVESALMAPLYEAAAKAAEAANAAEDHAIEARFLVKHGAYGAALQAAELAVKNAAKAEAAIPASLLERTKRIIHGEIIYLVVYAVDEADNPFETDTGVYATPFRTRAEAEKAAGDEKDVVPMLFGEECQVFRVRCGW